MKKSILISTYILLICLFVSISAPQVMALESYTYSVTSSVKNPPVGSEFKVSISLTNYDTTVENIRGLQIDVTNLDTEVFEIISHSTSIVDATAASNKTSYSSSNNRIRLTYASVSGTLAKDTKEVMSITLKVKDTITTSGNISIPVKVMIVSTDGNTTQNSTLEINYVIPTLNVDITWGAMEFNYDDGEWDSSTHKWINSGWKPAAENGNLITIQNNSTVPVSATLSYKSSASYPSLTGTFSNGTSSITQPISFEANSAKKNFWFSLSGKTEERWSDNYITVGTITITISE